MVESTALGLERESVLEDFVWENLKELLNLTPIARQYCIDAQVCDIVASDEIGRIVVIELKNTEDRYIVQQLTRYYDSLLTHYPFAEQVDYGQAIRLVAIAPTFHKHSLIDRKHSQLHYQFAYFKIAQTEAGSFQFNLTDLDTAQAWSLIIPAKFRPFIITSISSDSSHEPIRHLTRPPKSLRRIIEGISSETQARILEIREKILNFDKRMREVGLTTTTKYGLGKGDKDVYEGKLCAEFLPPIFPGISMPRLLLRLPYPKKELARLRHGKAYKQETTVKGMAWAETALAEHCSPTDIIFYLGKSRTSRSFQCSLEQYACVYKSLTGKEKKLASLNALIDVGLEEWLTQI